MFSRFFSLAAAVFLGLATLAPVPGAADDLTEFRLGGARGTTSLFPLIAREQGFDRKHGLDLKYFMHKQFGTIYTELLTGANQAATPSPDGLAALAAQGGPIHIAATLAQDSTALVGKGPAIEGAEDLRGKRVAAIVASGSWKQFQARIAEKFGLVAGTDYSIINAPDLAQGVAQVIAGTVDFAMGWEPSISAALNADPTLDIVLRSRDVLPEGQVAWQFVVGVRDDVPHDVEAKLVAVLSDAVAWMNENPDAADKIAVDELAYSPGVIKSILLEKRQVFHVNALTDTTIAEIKDQLRVFMSTGGIPALPGDSFYGAH